MNRSRQLGVKIERVPVHLLQTQNFLDNAFEIGTARMPANSEGAPSLRRGPIPER
jgi:hypothetical protein